MTKVCIVIVGLLISVSGYGQELEKFSENGKFGFRDKSGNIIIPAKYVGAAGFSEDLAVVQVQLDKNYYSGYIDKKGNEIIPFKYNYAGNFSEGLAMVELNGKHGFIDKNGKEVIPLIYDNINNKYTDINAFSEGLACVKLNGKWGFIDKTGKVVIPLKYDYAQNFSEGLAYVYVKLNGGCFVDRTGKEIIPLKYDYADNFSEGLATVRLDNKYGFIDKNGNETIPLKYQTAKKFSEGLAAVKLDNKYGFIDKNENVIIPLKYDHADNFSGGWARVMLPKVDNREKWVFVDKTGEFEYKSLEMKMIWENLLVYYIKQISDYRSSLINYGSFEIKRPYLLVSAESEKREDISFLRYSESNFNVQSLNDLKIIVVKYDYLYEHKKYSSNTIGVKGIEIESYGSYLIYFDVEKKKCIGYDKITGPNLPLLVNSSPYTTIQTRMEVETSEIIKKIETHVKSK